MVFKEHGLMLYLCPELQIANATLQARDKLGRSYSGLKALTEGYYRLGVLCKEDYERLTRKYSKGLVKEEKPLSLEQLQTKSEIEQMSKKFSMVLEQWNLERDNKQNWREGWIREAETWKDKVPNAELVLALVNEDDKGNVVRRIDSTESLKSEVEG
jgi:hypothetical protein